MTSTVFVAAIDAATARENEQRRLQEEQREAAKLERQRKAAERQQAAARREQEVAAHRRLLHDESFRDGFYRAVVKAGAHWSTQALQQAADYCEALASLDDVALPPIDPSIAVTIQAKFAYGVYRAGDRLPEGRFNGQRQPWFATALAANRPKPADPVRQGLRNSGSTIEQIMERPVPSQRSTATPVEERPAAVTPPQKRNPRKRKAIRKGRQ